MNIAQTQFGLEFAKKTIINVLVLLRISMLIGCPMLLVEADAMLPLTSTLLPDANLIDLIVKLSHCKSLKNT